jgi:hypothetical protein
MLSPRHKGTLKHYPGNARRLMLKHYENAVNGGVKVYQRGGAKVYQLAQENGPQD